MTSESGIGSSPDALDELNKKMDEGEEKGKQLIQIGRHLTEAGQFMVDLSQSTRDVLRVYKPVWHIELLNNDWDNHNRLAGIVLANEEEFDLPSFNSTTGTTVYTTSGAFNPVEVQASVPHEDWPQIEALISRVHVITSRMADKEEVSAVMASLGLDAAQKGLKSPLDLFMTAHDAFEKTVSDRNPISTSLIPIRESIRATIDILLRERPKQEKTGNEKTRSSQSRCN